MSKILLRIAGGLEIFYGVFVAGISLLWLMVERDFFVMSLSFLFFITAIVFLYIASLSESEMKEKRNIILIFSILALLTYNTSAGALGIATYMRLGDGKIAKKEKIIDKRMRKLSILLTLGVLLIVIAGAIFATSTWEILDGFVKTCVLIVVSLLFFGISGLAENKLKLKKSAITYYLLGCFFAITAYLAVGFFEIFGNWFSLNGVGQELFKASFYFFATLVFTMAYLKYRKAGILYFIELFVTVAIIYLCNFANILPVWILLSLLLLFGGLLLLNKKDKLPTLTLFSNWAFAITSIVLLYFMRNIATTKMELIVAAVSTVWTVSLVYAVALNRKNFLFRIFAPIAAVLLLTGLLIFSDASGLEFLIKFAIILLVVFMIAFVKKEDKLLLNVTLGVTDIAFTYLILDAIRLNFGYFSVIAAIVFLLLSFLIAMAGKLPGYHFERFVEPFKVLLLTYAVYKVLMTFPFAEDGLFLGVVALIFAIVQLVKKGAVKGIYFWASFVFAVLVILLNFTQNDAIVMPALVTGIFAILFVSSHYSEYSKPFASILYALFGVSLFTFAHNFTYKMPNVIFYMAALSSFYIVSGIVLQKNRILCNISCCLALLPLYVCAYILKLPIEVRDVISALIVLLFIISYTRGILKGVSWTAINIIETIAIGLWFLGLIFNADLLQGIIIGIVAILFVLVGYKSDKMWAYYYTGIGATILNLWVQLENVWSRIPFWVYLLFAGLLLVGFVTYQEYSSTQKKSDLEKEVPLKKEKDVAVAVSANQIVLGTIIYLLIFANVMMQLSNLYYEVKFEL